MLEAADLSAGSIGGSLNITDAENSVILVIGSAPFDVQVAGTPTITWSGGTNVPMTSLAPTIGGGFDPNGGIWGIELDTILAGGETITVANATTIPNVRGNVAIVQLSNAELSGFLTASDSDPDGNPTSATINGLVGGEFIFGVEANGGSGWSTPGQTWDAIVQEGAGGSNYAHNFYDTRRRRGQRHGIVQRLRERGQQLRQHRRHSGIHPRAGVARADRSRFAYAASPSPQVHVLVGSMHRLMSQSNYPGILRGQWVYRLFSHITAVRNLLMLRSRLKNISANAWSALAAGLLISSAAHAQRAATPQAKPSSAATTKPTTQPATTQPTTKPTPDPAVRKKRRERMINYLCDVYEKKMQSPDWATKGMAMISVARLPGERAGRIVTKATDDRHPFVQFIAMHAHLARQLNKDDDELARQIVSFASNRKIAESSRSMAIALLGALPPTREHQALLIRLLRSTSPLDTQSLTRAGQVLARWGDTRTLKGLGRELNPFERELGKIRWAAMNNEAIPAQGKAALRAYAVLRGAAAPATYSKGFATWLRTIGKNKPPGVSRPQVSQAGLRARRDSATTDRHEGFRSRRRDVAARPRTWHAQA